MPFGPRVTDEPPYRPSPAQAEAAEQLVRLAARLGQVRGGMTTLIIVGPEGSGKSRMVSETQKKAIDAFEGALLPAQGESPLALLAEMNRAAAAGEIIALEARDPPDQWFQGMEPSPDLMSRLDAAPLITLARPGAEALVPPLLADLTLHGHRLTPEEALAVADRLPRSFFSPRRFCRALEEAGPLRSRRQLLQWAAERVHVRLPEAD